MELLKADELTTKQEQNLRAFIISGKCGSEIPQSYALEILPEMKYVLLYTNAESKQVDGFVFLRDNFTCAPPQRATRQKPASGGCKETKDANNFYIELICASDYTAFEALLNTLIVIATDMKKQYISLSALPSVILLYARKFGFDLSLDCGGEAKEITTFKNKLIKEQVWKREPLETKTKKRKRNEERRTKNNEEITQDLEYQKFLHLLEQNNLSIAVNTKICKKGGKQMSKDRFNWNSDKNCVREGFYMVLCLDPKMILMSTKQ